MAKFFDGYKPKDHGGIGDKAYYVFVVDSTGRFLHKQMRGKLLIFKSESDRDRFVLENQSTRIPMSPVDIVGSGDGTRTTVALAAASH